jgi:hypothetical protein
MCNLYSITTNQGAIAALFRVMNRYVGNQPPMPLVFPDYPAPVIRNAGAERELIMMRWGMPPPPRAGDQHQEYILPALARMAETGKPLPRPGQQLQHRHLASISIGRANITKNLNVGATRYRLRRQCRE